VYWFFFFSFSCSGFWPTVKVFLCEVPFLGWVIRYIFWWVILYVVLLLWSETFSCRWMFCLHGTHYSIVTVGSYLSSLGYSWLVYSQFRFCSSHYYAEEYHCTSQVCHICPSQRVGPCVHCKEFDHRKYVTFMGLWSLTIGYCGNCCSKRCILRLGMEEGPVRFSYHVHCFLRENRLEVKSLL
jgi:hypothetical protein